MRAIHHTTDYHITLVCSSGADSDFRSDVVLIPKPVCHYYCARYAVMLPIRTEVPKVPTLGTFTFRRTSADCRWRHYFIITTTALKRKLGMIYRICIIVLRMTSTSDSAHVHLVTALCIGSTCFIWLSTFVEKSAIVQVSPNKPTM